MELSESGLLLKKTIKELLKSHQKTQSELAHHLEISLAMVKKLLSSGDIGFERLVNIAGFFGLRVHELIQISSSQQLQLSKATADQDRFISEHPIYSKILKSLFSGMDLNTIKRRYNLADSVFAKRLAEMEDAHLITIDKNKEVRLKVLWPLKLDPNSKYALLRLRKWIEKTLERTLAELSSGSSYLDRFEFYCSTRTAGLLREELKVIGEKYRHIAGRDMKTHPHEQLSYYSYISVLGSFSGWDLIE